MMPTPDPVLGRLLAQAWSARQQGRFAEATMAYRQAIALTPEAYRAWAGLAECEFAARRPEAALAAWAQALRIAPRSAQALGGMGDVRRSIGQAASARELYGRALAVDPGWVAARLGLAGLYFDAGQLEPAAAALADLPPGAGDRPDVLWLSARIAQARGDLDTARDGLAALLAMPLDAGQRADALLLHGEVLGEAGEPAAAFAAAVAGKAHYHRLYAERAASRESEVAKSDRLGRWWGCAPPAAWAGAARAGRAANEAAQHVFLLGFPRSGTTLLEQVLAGHPAVLALEEAPTLAEHYAEFLSSDAGCARLAGLAADEADTWRVRYWATVAAHGVDARKLTFVDKAPAGTLTLPLIAKLFPDAKILFALRDPRDVVLSCLRNAFQMNAMTYAFTTLTGAAACYDAVMGMAAAYRERLPLPLLDVRHEALLADFDAELARITAFLGLDPQPAMRDVAATAAGRSVRTPSARQVRAGLNRRGVDRWRACAAELAPVLPLLEPWVAAFGYSSVGDDGG